MTKRPVRSTVPPSPDQAAPEQDSRYAPRSYSSGEQLAFAAKAGLILAALVILLWVLDRNV